MPGIYIHIPFCKQACHYCDFHFSTSLKNKEAFLFALKREMELRKNYLSPGDGFTSTRVKSIYFGGGTPSLLSAKDILEIFEHLNKYFSFDGDAEITLEANPDDLTKEKILEFKKTPINRLSIGIQSFADEDLKFMNRAHNVQEALGSVKDAQDEGFSNISIDLIYGTPTLTNRQWKANLDTACTLNVQHISAYCLTVEPKTALAVFIKNGKIENLDEIKAIDQFKILMDEMEKNHFIQYEISNFSKQQNNPDGSFGSGSVAIHNSSYWKGDRYIGLGPSAHSFDGNSRQWNVSNNNTYIKSLEKNELKFEKEILTADNLFNEYVLTSLRTMWGCDLKTVKTRFDEKYLAHLNKTSMPYIQENKMVKKNNILFLTNRGKFIADKITSDLFI